MSIKFLQTTAAVAIIGLASINTHAASIWLEPASLLGDPQVINVGGTANLELWADGEGVAFLAGGLDVFYDETIISYNDDFRFADAFPTDPDFSRPGTSGDPDNCTTDPSALGCSGPGEINGIAFGNFNGIADTPTLVGTLSFTGLGLGLSPVTMANNDLPAGDWYDTSGNLMDVVYGDPVVSTASVNVVPVPAAVWLFGTGLLGLIGVARRRK